jgi:hypothetical protein
MIWKKYIERFRLKKYALSVLENMGSIEVGWPEISDILGLRDTPYIYLYM